jgi:hypothetical protein
VDCRGLCDCVALQFPAPPLKNTEKNPGFRNPWEEKWEDAPGNAGASSAANELLSRLLSDLAGAPSPAAALALARALEATLSNKPEAAAGFVAEAATAYRVKPVEAV